MRDSSISQLPQGVALLSVRQADSALIRAAIREKRLVRAAPRVVMGAGHAHVPQRWVEAVHAWRPSAVITGDAALSALHGARATFPVNVVLGTTLTSTRPKQVRFWKSALAPELIVDDGSGAFTVDEISVMACAVLGGMSPGSMAPACLALNEGWVTLNTLGEAAALLGSRSWLGRRAPRILADLRDRPWSVPELELHRMLRQNGIAGWSGNAQVDIGGQIRQPDIAFEEARLAVEMNSYEFHSSRTQLQRDAERTAEFMRAGWMVLPVTPSMIERDPGGVIDTIRVLLGLQNIRKPSQ